MQHPFLDESVCVHRLVTEYKQHESLVIAYDFDNTVFDYHSKNHNYNEIVLLLREAKEINCHLIVFTAEPSINKVADFLNGRSIPFDSINENPPFFKSTSRKIYYNLLLDDRAGLLSAYNQLKSVINIIKNQI